MDAALDKIEAVILNTFEASGANGKFDRHSCKKGKCDHFTEKAYVPYGEEWERNTMKLPRRHG